MNEPNNSGNIFSGINKYWQVIAGILVAAFAVGGILEKIKDYEKELAAIRNEQEFKKSSYDEMEQRVDDLEEWKAFQEGYQKALKEMKNDKP